MIQRDLNECPKFHRNASVVSGFPSQAGPSCANKQPHFPAFPAAFLVLLMFTQGLELKHFQAWILNVGHGFGAEFCTWNPFSLWFSLPISR